MKIEKLTKYQRVFLEILPIIILGLVPLLWFKPGYLITGIDINFPLYPQQEFLRRLYTWNQVFLGGTDRSMDLSTLFFIGVQAFLHKLGLSLINTEKLSFIFWFMLFGFSMYFFMRQLIRGESPKDRIIRVISTVFFMFNFYQLYEWEVVRIGEGGGLIIIPTLLALYIRGVERKSSLISITVGICIFSIIGAGIGIQPPVLGVFFLALFAYFVFYLLFSFINRVDKRKILWCIKFSVFFVLVFSLVSMFWLLPIGHFVVQAGYTSVSTGSEVYEVSKLLKWTSSYNSFLNLFRQFGDIFWFDGWGGDRYTPYFQAYQTNVLLIFLSFMLPILAYACPLFSRHRYIIFFALLILIATFLSKGMHPPLGNINLWLTLHLPGFWIYRAPWQKFGLLVSLGYSFLAGITCGNIYQRLRDRCQLKDRPKVWFLRTKRSIPSIFLFSVVFLNIAYSYPLIFGRMFPTHQDFKVLHGVHQKMPRYLFDASNWINSKTEEFKILTLPDDKTNVYRWGYAGAQDITISLFNKSIIFRQYGEGTTPPRGIDKIHQVLISSLYQHSTANIVNILKLVNIQYLLQRNDFQYDFYGDSDSPRFIEEKLALQRGVHLEKSFDEWDFYKIDTILPHIYASPDKVGLED